MTSGYTSKTRATCRVWCVPTYAQTCGSNGGLDDDSTTALSWCFGTFKNANRRNDAHDRARVHIVDLSAGGPVTTVTAGSEKSMFSPLRTVTRCPRCESAATTRP